MLIEDLTILPFFDEGNPARVIVPLVEFITEAPLLTMSGSHEAVQRANEIVGLSVYGAKFGNAYDLDCIFAGHG
jgi:hypothetical protein